MVPVRRIRELASWFIPLAGLSLVFVSMLSSHPARVIHPSGCAACQAFHVHLESDDDEVPEIGEEMVVVSGGTFEPGAQPAAVALVSPSRTR